MNREYDAHRLCLLLSLREVLPVMARPFDNHLVGSEFPLLLELIDLLLFPQNTAPFPPKHVPLFRVDRYTSKQE